MIALLLVCWVGAGSLGGAVAHPPPRPATAQAAAVSGSDKLSFWDRPRKGANCQNRQVTPAYWRAARAAGIEFVRLIPDGWPAHRRDFLIGDADGYTKLDSVDLARLRRVLDDAHAAGVRVVLTMFSLPGARWKQLNDDRDDTRVWREPGFRMQCAWFWRDLAGALRDHPAIVGYDPLNEPHPERAFGLVDPDSAAFQAWYAQARGTLADLNAFHRNVWVLIREADQRTPIMIGGWSHASAAGLTHLEPLDDPAVLYSFHEYEPWIYTTFRENRGRFRFPDRMPEGWNAGDGAVRAARVRAWAARHGIPPSRIVVAEFGVDRRVGGAAGYLTETIRRYDAEGWHWAFYSYRSDDAWGGLDYELGTEPLGDAYWRAVERGADTEPLKRRRPNPLWRVIERALTPSPSTR
jgi:hypothetical protein